MFIFLILLLSALSTIHCIETPSGKRTGQDLVSATKRMRTDFCVPTLEGIPDDAKKLILGHVMIGDSANADDQTDHLIKANHPCFRISKKFNRLSEGVFEQLLLQNGPRSPQRMMDLINKSAMFPRKNGSLVRFIKSPLANAIIFNCVTPRITPLMVAVGYNNEAGVQLLLDEAKKRGILNQYVNLNCGMQHNDSATVDDSEELPFDFHCARGSTALHIAADTENDVPVAILKSLLNAGADPNLQDGERLTPLFLAMPVAINHPVQKVRELYMFGADPRIGPEGSEMPEVLVNEELARHNLAPRMRQVYNWISLLFQTPRQFYDFIVREHEPRNL